MLALSILCNRMSQRSELSKRQPRETENNQRPEVASPTTEPAANTYTNNGNKPVCYIRFAGGYQPNYRSATTHHSGLRLMNQGPKQHATNIEEQS